MDKQWKSGAMTRELWIDRAQEEEWDTHTTFDGHTWTIIPNEHVVAMWLLGEFEIVELLCGWQNESVLEYWDDYSEEATYAF